MFLCRRAIVHLKMLFVDGIVLGIKTILNQTIRYLVNSNIVSSWGRHSAYGLDMQLIPLD